MKGIRRRFGLDCRSHGVRLVRAGEPGILEDLAAVALEVPESGYGQRVLGIGNEALQAASKREAGKVEIVWPVAGAVHDYVACEAMLRQFCRKTSGRISLLKPDVIAVAPAGCSEAEKLTLHNAVFSSADAADLRASLGLLGRSE